MAAAKAEISGAFGRSLESPQTIAGFALNTAKYKLSKDYYANYLKSIDAVTLADVQATAKKFIRPDNANIIVVGKASDVADKLKTFGEVRYFDIYGESYVPSKASAIPAGLTAERVIEKYFDAIGGAEKIAELKSLKSTYKGLVQGMELTITNSQKSPNKVLIETSVAGMGVMSKQVIDGKVVSLTQQGQKLPVDGSTTEVGLFEAAIVPEANLSQLKAKTTLTGIEMVEGKEAYAVEIVFPQGGKIINYYDTKDGLKVQTVKFGKGPQGEVSVPTLYENYKEVLGVKLPQTMTLSMGPMKLKMEIATQDVNPKLEDTLFKID